MYRIFLKVNNLCDNLSSEFVDFLKNYSCVNSVCQICGKWNFIVSCLVKNKYELNNLMRKISFRFGKNIATSKRIAPLIRCLVFSSNKLTSKDYIYAESGDHINLSECDRELIRLLSQNSNYSIVEISKKLNIPTSTITRHIRRLEKSKIILGYKVDINFSKLEFSDYTILLYTKISSLSELQSLTYYVSVQPETISISESIGFADFECKIRVKYAQELIRFMNNLKSKFSNQIIDSKLLLTVGKYKCNSCPY